MSRSNLFQQYGGRLLSRKQRQFIRQTLKETDKTLAFQRNDSKINFGVECAQLHKTTSIDKTYSMMLKCTEIKCNQSYRVFLQPYTEEYFSFDMGIFTFPLEFQITKLSAQGFLYIGYNQEYPGLSNQGNESFDKISQSKYLISKIQNIKISQPGNRVIQKLYFLFASNKKFLNIDFKLKEFQESKLKQNRVQKIYTENSLFLKKQKKIDHIKKPRIKTEYSQGFSRKSISYLQRPFLLSQGKDKISSNNFTFLNQKSFKKLSIPHSSSFARYSVCDLNLLTNSFQRKKSVNSTQCIKKQKSYSIANFQRTYFCLSSEKKQQRSRKNLNQLQKHKQKTQNLKNLVKKFKKYIGSMKTINDEKLLKEKKVVKNLTVLIKIHKFMSRCHFDSMERKKYLSKSLITVVNVLKFIKKLTRRKKRSQQLVQNRKIRLVYGFLPLTQLLTSVMQQRAQLKAQKVVSITIIKLFQSMVLRQVLQDSQIYLNKVRKIQIYYRLRLQSQKRMLKLSCNKFREEIVQNLSHLKKFQKSFIEQNITAKLISVYLKDEILKFNRNRHAFEKQAEEREEFIKIKKEIIENKKPQVITKIRMKKKSVNSRQQNYELQIPGIKKKPYSSLFRNLQILYSMVRNWFELQNLKWARKEKVKNWD